MNTDSKISDNSNNEVVSLELMEEEMYFFLISKKYTSEEAERLISVLKEDLPAFLKKHEIVPRFESMFMTHDQNIILIIEKTIQRNPYFKRLNESANNVYTDSLKKYGKFCASTSNPYSIAYKEEHEEDPDCSEGNVLKSHTNRYERNRKARLLCIKHYKCKCYACGFDFEKVYGEKGKDYIEVHHVVPVSSIGKRYRVDPIKDLRPLCSNCHSIIHRYDPIISVEDFMGTLNKGLTSNGK